MGETKPRDNQLMGSAGKRAVELRQQLLVKEAEDNAAAEQTVACLQELHGERERRDDAISEREIARTKVHKLNRLCTYMHGSML